MVIEGVTEEQWAEHRAVLAARRPFGDSRYQRTGSDGVIHHISVPAAAGQSVLARHTAN